MAPTPGVLAPSELRAAAEKFGVADEQVRRDHLISHVLAAIQGVAGLVFYGGTALTRTALPDLRLSEDIDLLVTRPRAQVARELVEIIDDALARSFGEVRWAPRLEQTRDAQPASLEVFGRLSVQVQLVSQTGRAAWPSRRRSIDQRYSDAPPAVLDTLTDTGFAAAKISAWLDRAECRDLFDLYSLTHAGMVTLDSAELVKRATSWSRFPDGVVWPKAPTDSEWQEKLGHQTRVRVNAAEAYEWVRRELNSLGREGAKSSKGK